MISLFCWATTVGFAYDLNDQLSVEMLLSGAYQHQTVSDARDAGRGAVTFQPDLSFRPTTADELHFKMGFAAGQALSDGTSPFMLSPWAADLEDDVKNINGRDRDYLLTAWYKHRFHFSDRHTLSLTGGIVDATEYVDQNAYANDGYTQFMNEALVNASNGFAPSFDIGGAAEWGYNRLIVSGVVMNIGENDDGNSYSFYALQVAFQSEFALGIGNYRLVYQHGSKDFLSADGTSLAARHAVLLSCDQQLGDVLGAWVRIGSQDNDAAINYQSLYSGGFDVSGKLWGRTGDNLGIAYAYLTAGNQTYNYSQVFEGYLRLLLNEMFALTFDLQYLKDDLKTGAGPDGFIYGLRMSARF